MEENFYAFIQEIYPISKSDFNHAMSFFENVTLKKGDVFIKQGQTCKKLGYIKSGLLRAHYINKNGEDITSCFCSKHDFTTSFKSFVAQDYSNTTISAIEQTELLVISYDKLQNLYDENPVWQKIGRLIVEKELLKMEQYVSFLNNETAKEKYLRLLKEQPEVLQKSPLKYIGSYLGVTRRTLSRIRKELSK